MKHDPKQKMTSTANTSSSAIGVIKKDKNDKPMLTIFHNKYSEVPLAPDLFAKFSIKQYEVEDINKSMKWKEITRVT